MPNANEETTKDQCGLDCPFCGGTQRVPEVNLNTIPPSVRYHRCPGKAGVIWGTGFDGAEPPAGPDDG